MCECGATWAACPCRGVSFFVTSRLLPEIFRNAIVAIRGISLFVLRVLSDNRTDGHHFIFCREFTPEAFLRCYQQAHREIFGMLEITTMIDFLMLRLRGALNQPWMEDTPQLRRSVVSGKVNFADLRGLVFELIPVRESVREFVRYAGPRHVKSVVDMVGRCLYYIVSS